MKYVKTYTKNYFRCTSIRTQVHTFNNKCIFSVELYPRAK